MAVSDLLADGELLFEVSKVAWKMLLTNHRELRHVKAYINEPFASRKSSGRYMPYSNVDSFLKICKILGLTGIDLLSIRRC
ncbi:protein OPAQUE10-like [Castanea sativa]|uniref:protein OPAQUE10-like n=1 Tax=Castanea sativa TaxID=21020 RepID=UPI003F65187B